MKSNVYNNNT